MKLLVLTNHETHSEYDSIYGIAEALHKPDINCSCFIASVSFDGHAFNAKTDLIQYREYDSSFTYESVSGFFQTGLMTQGRFDDFDVIFFRVDRRPGFPDAIYEFSQHVSKNAPSARYVNSPSGLWETRSKIFLENFRDICPPFDIVSSVDKAFDAFPDEPFVLKPLDGYGGKGIIRVNSRSEISTEKGQFTGLDAERYLESLNPEYFPTMAMRYLKNVSKGDKRIIVSSGKCLGAVLRVPKADSWLANLAQGASSEPSDTTLEENEIIERVDPVLRQAGIMLYGLDTLVNDDGKRVLSEINTANVGGLLQIQITTGQPIFQKMANGIYEGLGA